MAEGQYARCYWTFLKYPGSGQKWKQPFGIRCPLWAPMFEYLPHESFPGPRKIFVVDAEHMTIWLMSLEGAPLLVVLGCSG
jgi:hypothetical protein